MRLIKLTGIGHPDIDGGRPSAVYVDPTRILTVEAGTTQYPKHMSIENHRQTLNGLFEEVERVVGEAKQRRVHHDPQNEQHCRENDTFLWARDSAAALTAAYQLVARTASTPELYPLMPCTTLSLACGTGLEHGVMLSRVFVKESPEDVAKLMETPPGICLGCGRGEYRP